ncbi:MAG: hypothetical protein R2939_04910 [Kofleriaceae bacterium]
MRGLLAVALMGAGMLAACGDDAGTVVVVRMVDDRLGDDDPVVVQLVVGESLAARAGERRYLRQFDPDVDLQVTTAGALRDGVPLLFTADHAGLRRKLAVVAWAGTDRLALPPAQARMWFAATELAVDLDVARRYELELEGATQDAAGTLPYGCGEIAVTAPVQPLVALRDGAPAGAAGDHCLRWRDADGVAVVVRTDAPDDGCAFDHDGDGFFLGDGDTEYAYDDDGCRVCTNAPGTCECDDAPATGADVHVGAAEGCGDVDLNCDGKVTTMDALDTGSFCLAASSSGPGTTTCRQATLACAGDGRLECALDPVSEPANAAPCASVDCVTSASCAGGDMLEACEVPTAGHDLCPFAARLFAMGTSPIVCSGRIRGGASAGWDLTLRGRDGADVIHEGREFVEADGVRCSSVEIVTVPDAPAPVPLAEAIVVVELMVVGSLEPRFFPVRLSPVVDGAVACGAEPASVECLAPVL